MVAASPPFAGILRVLLYLRCVVEQNKASLVGIKEEGWGLMYSHLCRQLDILLNTRRILGVINLDLLFEPHQKRFIQRTMHHFVVYLRSQALSYRGLMYLRRSFRKRMKRGQRKIVKNESDSPGYLSNNGPTTS